MVTMAGLIPMVRFPVTTVVCRLMVPEKPLLLVTLTTDVPDEPAAIVIELGLALLTKSGVALVEKMAVCTVSEPGLVEACAITPEAHVLLKLRDAHSDWHH